MNDDSDAASVTPAVASPTPSPVHAAADRILAALSAALSREDGVWIQKLSLLNRTLQGTDAAAGCQSICAGLSHTLTCYPQLIAEAADECTGPEPESVALLRSCPTCLCAFLAHLASGSCACPAALSAPLLLHMMAWIIGLALSSHALVSEVGRTTFGLAYRGMDASFARCATQMMMGALAGSVESVAAEFVDAASREFGLNVAQARIIEILAHNAHLMPKDTQLYLFRHFNLSLTPAAQPAGPASLSLSLAALCAPPDGWLPVSFLSALMMGARIEALDPSIVTLLYRHTFSDCLTELSEFLSKPWSAQCESLPLVAFLIEMTTAACRTAPPAAAALDPAFMASFTGQAATLLLRLVDALCGVMHSHVPSGKLSPSLGVALVVSSVRALHTPLLFPAVSFTAWTKLFGALHRVHAVVGASLGDAMLREAVLAVAQCAVPVADQARFVSDVLRPAFHIILQPKNTSEQSAAAATAAAAASSAVPASSQSSSSSAGSSVDDCDEAGFDCFFRFSCNAGDWWSRYFRDLMPAPVRTRLVSYVQARSKSVKTLPVGFNGRPERAQRFGVETPTNHSALSADQLRAEAVRLKLEAAAESEELHTAPVNSDLPLRIAALKQAQAPVILAAWSEADYMVNDA